jgi:hypothetical protein
MRVLHQLKGELPQATLVEEPLLTTNPGGDLWAIKSRLISPEHAA